MAAFELVSDKDLAGLPEDPRLAFAEIVRIAGRNIDLLSKTLNTTDLNAAKYSAINIIIGAAQNFGVADVARLSIPSLSSFGAVEYDQTMATLQRYVILKKLEGASAVKSGSVAISVEARSAISTYIHHLRELIDKSNEIDDWKKKVLLRRLDEFEAELTSKRFNLVALAVLLITFAGAPGAVSGTYDAGMKILASISRVVGDAKIAEDAIRAIPATAAPLAISAPPRSDGSGAP